MSEIAYAPPTTGLTYSEAIANLEISNPPFQNSELGIDETGVTWPTNVEIARAVGGALAEGLGRRITFGTFDNCREYGLTFTAGDWTFCCFEHRNSDQIMVEGCPTAEMKEWGPYGCYDKYSMMWHASDGHYQSVTRALSAVLVAALNGPLTRLEAIAILGGAS
ncbi:hypothetical protein [Mycolicibacter heraklionensis]|uniref:hypothetical protein n=1 Tax=Mycolicibacter heraklionensis TaxID=512402 RepID=UPI0007EA75C3|nr:hypothetical protein [Mycolicibacter heraklionensis]OBG32386.1 hypothetical protein A5671_07590 [Mycolicibacter heraklionensis]